MSRNGKQLVGLLLAFLMLPSGTAWAQQAGTVTGTITDADTGDPLPGANIILAQTNEAGDVVNTTDGLGAAAGVNGGYTITDVPEGDYALRATYIGYQSFEQNVTVTGGETVTVDVSMALDAIGLEDVCGDGAGARGAGPRAGDDDLARGGTSAC